MKKIMTIVLIFIFITFILYIPSVAVESTKRMLEDTDFRIEWTYSDWVNDLPKDLDGVPIVELQYYVDNDFITTQAYPISATDSIWRWSDCSWTRDVFMGCYQPIKNGNLENYYKFPNLVRSYEVTDAYSIQKTNENSWGSFFNPMDNGTLERDEQETPCIRDLLDAHYNYLSNDDQFQVRVPLPKEIAILMELGIGIKPVVYCVYREGGVDTLAYITDKYRTSVTDFRKVGEAKVGDKMVGQYSFNLSMGFKTEPVDTKNKLLDYVSVGKDKTFSYQHEFHVPIGDFKQYNVLVSLYPGAKAVDQSILDLKTIDGATGRLNPNLQLNGNVYTKIGQYEDHDTWNSGGAIGISASAKVYIAYYADVSSTNVVKVYDTDDKHDKTVVEVINNENEYNILGDGDYITKEWFTTTEPMQKGITAETAWSVVESITPKAETGSGVGTVDLEEIKTIYIHYVKEGVKESTGDIILTESRISKLFKMSEVTDIIARTASVSTRFGNHIHDSEDCIYISPVYDAEGIQIGSGYWAHGTDKFGSWTDANFRLVFSHTGTISHIAKADLYVSDRVNPKDIWGIHYNSNVLDGVVSGASHTTTPVKTNFDFIVYREEQLPTLAKYAYAIDKSKGIGNHAEILAQIGIIQANKLAILRQKESYSKTLSFNITLGKSIDGQDLDVSAVCNFGTHTENHKYVSSSAIYNINLLIQKYNDISNVGKEKASVLNNATATINGKTIGHLTANLVSGLDSEDVKFFPYVEMVYDTLLEKDAKVNVLADNISTFKANDYFEMGWSNSRPDDSLIVSSTQWSTHTRATTGTGWRQKNRVLPGGAIFSIGHNASAKTTVGVVTWQTYVEDEVRTALSGDLINGDKYKLADKVFQHTTVVNALKSELEKTGVQMWINTNYSLSPYSGQKVGSGVTFNGQKLSADSKYWFQKDSMGTSTKNTEGDLDIITGSEKTQKTYYRMRADVDGSVYLERQGPITGNPTVSNWNILQKWDKTVVTPTLSDEPKEIDDRTKLITNFFKCLDRNKGDDQGSWYHEAFRGICVVKSETTFDVGFEKPAERKAILDPRLEPVRKSTSDYFSTAFVLGIRVEEKVISVEFGTIGSKSKTTLKDVQNIYCSKPFYIPNVSVTDSVF